jgi:hypothetical protein
MGRQAEKTGKRPLQKIFQYAGKFNKTASSISIGSVAMPCRCRVRHPLWARHGDFGLLELQHSRIRWTFMDRKPASHLGHVVWIVEKLWINATFDFQRAIHSSHI